METIADAYENNARIHEKLKSVVSNLTPEQLSARPEGGKWSVEEIVEHIAMVYEGTGRICAKLAAGAKAGGKLGDGKVNLSEGFGEKSEVIAGMKVEAPETVHPTGGATLHQSLARIEETERFFDGLRPELESFDLSEHTFPHPFFGQITAAEWLVLAGGHAARHTKQIERLKERL
jgi:hypothetical protein